MSTSQSRLIASIRRIAREQPDQSSSVGGSSNRGGQPGGQGIGQDDQDDRVCCDGSVARDANPGTTTRSTDGVVSDGLDASDPARLDIEDACVVLVDCENQQPINFCGGDWVPPPYWDEPNPTTPPLNPNYVEGRYVIGPGPFTCSNVLAARPVGDDSDGWRGGFCNVSSSLCWSTAISRGVCSPSLEDISIGGGLWPSNGAVDLAIIDGKIVGSKYDPENDGSYSAPRDEIELCDPETGDSILIRPSADGGWKSIKSLDGDIDPDTGAGYLYRPNGSRVRQISPSEFRDDTV